MFYPDLPPSESAMLVFCLSGMTAGATRSLSPLLRACWIFQIFAQVPIIVRFFLSGETVQYFMGGTAVAYLFILLAMAKSFRQTLSNSLRNGFAHADVVGVLVEEQERTEHLNLSLTAENERRQQAERALRDARDRAEAETRAKSEFLATMGHEIRAPMTGVMGMLELLKGTALTPAQREQVETAARSSESLLRMLNDIIAFSKIETGRMDLEAIPFHPQSLVEEVVDLLRARANAKSLTVQLRIGRASDARVLGDATRFRQVVVNLVGNAIRFTARGSVDLSLDAAPEPGPKVRLTLRVRDTGIGMSEETRARLFEPVVADFGLAISQTLIRRMGGTLTATSRPDEGSEFTVTLVLPVAGGQTPTSADVLGPKAPHLFDGRVLVVEDDQVNQRVITLMLDRLGIRCHVVGDGVTALSVMQQGDWDLVLMDCLLPGMDGFETTRQAKALLSERTPPIVALTANVRPEDREACRRAGMVDFLAKPVRVDSLRACLSRWLHQSA
jgi:signal transduction histidine kinase